MAPPIRSSTAPYSLGPKTSPMSPVVITCDPRLSLSPYILKVACSLDDIASLHRSSAVPRVNDMETAAPRPALATWGSFIIAKARFLQVLYVDPFRALVPSMGSHINECEDPRTYPCRGRCENLPGSYTCEDVDNRRIIAIVVSATLKWRIRKINFKRNGGKHLKRQGVKIFTEAELAKTTDSYDESKKLGEGGFGSVYRGRVVVDVEIVVKKAKDVHKPLMKNGFQDVLKIVTQTKHKKVVRLYGICLETRIPLLVYEYISNGTLFEHIHLNMSTILRSWENRLRIAAKATFVLKEMHSSEIIHGNNKSVNILPDQNCSVKVSDFGTSALISPEHIVATEIEGTLGYIDPEYLTTGKLTIKSDVYSFGVVLVELLTKRKPASSVADKSGEPINIIPYFISSVKDKSISGVINFEAASEDEIKQV
ncbi:wall-associated receptor kinase 3-like [Eucalyptus grandis]|uniref:wall-associated receptor kinase 3-like n=1 Tax=Eucalyptus grandis TaxID=71139 RepID=UPI00192E87C8|nr:wall-associated receptor kinase 3-like [Eucalyptus grandis]